MVSFSKWAQINIVKALGEKQAKYLDTLLRNQYSFHKPQGKCIAFTLLVKAFRENALKAAAFFAGTFIHAVADSSAFNHSPLIHLFADNNEPTQDWTTPILDSFSTPIFLNTIKLLTTT